MVASSRWMSQLECHPSIIIWVVFNEAWGQFNTVEVGIAIGGIAIDVIGVGDIIDFQKDFPHACPPQGCPLGGQS